VPLETYTVTAANHPEHADNAIHTDAGAQAAGFPRALVAGVTTYAYLTEPVIRGWGDDWVARGGGEVRFKSPVFDQDVVRCVPVVDGDAFVIEARVGEDPSPRAVFRVAREAEPAPALRDGERLTPVTLELRGRYGARHGQVAHPSVWPALANHVVHRQVARGSWIHLRSIVRHHGLVPAGSSVTIESVVVDRSERGGERAILDVHVLRDGAVVASLEHEAIVALAG
jgi:acyl dehydratase